jgi:HEPN domain-containing protein
MPLEAEEAGSPADWLRHARSDLAYATAPRPVGGLLEVPCFHAQQAAEKSIKAVLVALEVGVPRTHNLTTLIEHVPPSVAVPPDVKDATVLTDYAVSARYPGIAEPIEEDEYRQAVAHARRVLAWAESVIPALEG